MIQEEIRVQVLIPSKGYKLTQSKKVDIANRIISDKVYLGVFDTPSDWIEITDEEANEILAQQKELSEKVPT
jgi:hypothetical protein